MDKRNPSKTSWIVVALVVAVLCAGAYFAARGIVSNRSGALRSATQTSATVGQSVEALGNGMLYYDASALHALGADGKQLWSYAAGTNADFDVYTGGVAAWSGVTLSLLNATNGTALFSGNMDDNVIDARLGKYFAAVQLGEEHNSTMLIMESSGRQIDSIPLKNQTVLDFGFFNNDQLFWVMSLDTEGTVPVCSISSYRPGKTLAGTITDMQQVLYEVVFQSSKIRAVGTTHIKDFDYSGKEITDERILVYGWYLMGIDEKSDNPLMAFVPIDQADGTNPITDVRMIRGQIDQRVRLPLEAMRVVAMGDTVYAFTNQYVMVCQLGVASPTTYALPVYVDTVLRITENNTAIVSSGGRIYLIPLQ